MEIADKTTNIDGKIRDTMLTQPAIEWKSFPKLILTSTIRAAIHVVAIFAVVSRFFATLGVCTMPAPASCLRFFVALSLPVCLQCWYVVAS